MQVGGVGAIAGLVEEAVEVAPELTPAKGADIGAIAERLALGERQLERDQLADATLVGPGIDQRILGVMKKLSLTMGELLMAP